MNIAYQGQLDNDNDYLIAAKKSIDNGIIQNDLEKSDIKWELVK